MPDEKAITVYVTVFYLFLFLNMFESNPHPNSCVLTDECCFSFSLFVESLVALRTQI